MNRRSFLKSSTALIALPQFASLGAQPKQGNFAKRIVCMGNYLGYHTPSFYPKETGFGYNMPELLSPLKDLRNDFTVFSGLDHRCKNGHGNWDNFMTGQNVHRLSLDQLIAERVGGKTRFSSLQLATGTEHNRRISYTRDGVKLPCVLDPEVLFSSIFTSGENKAKMKYNLDAGKSIIDDLVADAKSFSRQLSKSDKNKLGEYLSSVRGVEKDIQKQKHFLNKPLRKVDFSMPEATTDKLEIERIFQDLTAVAFETDSTRVATLMYAINGGTYVNGKSRTNLHGLSHHNRKKKFIEEFNLITQQHIINLARFMKTLKERTDLDGKPLLDSTILIFGSGVGDANSHKNSDLPTIVAGGGFKHGSHISVGKDDPYLLGDLFLTVLHRMGFEDSTFAKSKNNMNNLFTV
ncbi:MAG: DUF1552 domain-containing protein [Lentisphaeraceae bacterium]|nr:DUF1552 domain-containing protein [Lentisphaeraceae bacterium]